ncbi:MAG: nucleotidyltransferase [Nitrospinae bacterium]|nr:nucleotidyltransferase [Nitrospinota bacterium]
MAAQDAEGPKSRPPTIDDLLAVCKKLNEKGVKYVLIGGFAMNYYGFPRATEDIDLLKKACDITFDKAVIEYFEFKGVRIPIADISTMVKTKQGVRPRDKEDLLFLENILEEEGR